MNKVVYSVSRGLTLTAIAAITSLTNSTVPLSFTNSQTASFPNLQSSGSVKNQLVDTPLKAGESDRVQETKESLRKLELSLAKTVTLVKELEGFRSYAYIDSDGTTVIGYGMSVIEGKKVKLGDRFLQPSREYQLTDF